MAVVRNLMLRIGADYTGMRKGMQGASRQLHRFERDTERSSSKIRGRKGLGGISTEFQTLGRSVTDSLTRIRGAKGIGGVASELGTLRPIMGSATRGLTGLGVAAGGAGAAFGGAALAIGAFVAVLGIATVGVYAASQAAVRFEADLGRLNMQLQGGSRAYIDWARAQGLAKQSAVEMGATYSTLLSSFVKDNQELSKQTQQIVQTTRVVASATGRTIADVTERMRSGLLGNTEAIEDLGIFVNVSMIESTKAFRRFAGDKSWEQLDFRMQQQIRLAAIMEQAYDRYGDSLQDNVMTKQELLMEQLKDIKLNLSQAFQPIWDAILPALTEMAEALAYTTEQLARFSYWVRGWDYDERTRGMDEEADAIGNVGDAYEETGKQAAKARSELAAFDRLNLIGSGSSSGSGGSGGSGGGNDSPSPDGENGNDPGDKMPKLPPIPPLDFTFFSNALKAVVTRIKTTFNEINSFIKEKLKGFWNEVKGFTNEIVNQIQEKWGQLVSAIRRLFSPLEELKVNWKDALSFLLDQLNAHIPSLDSGLKLLSLAIRNVPNVLEKLKNAWKGALSSLQQQLNEYRPYLEWGFHLIAKAVRNLINPLEAVKTAWKGALSFMQQQLNEYRPYLEWGWHLLAVSVRNLEKPLADIRAAWNSTWQSMLSTVSSKVSGIVSQVGQAIASMDRLRGALGIHGKTPATSPTGSPSSVPITGGLPTPWENQEIFRETLGDRQAPIDYEGLPLSPAGRDLFERIQNDPYFTPGGGGLGKSVSKAFPFLKELLERGFGKSIPGFATGAIVHGPTLAMVGDNPGAMSDPEIIAPLSKLNDMIDTGASDEEIDLLRQILQAVRDPKTVRAIVSQNDITQASITGINDQTRRRGGRSPLTT